MPKKRSTRVLAAGPKATLQALRALAAVGATSGDAYVALRNPSLWPHTTHEAVKDAWTVLATGGSGFEIPAHVVSATLDAVRGLKLVPGFKVRLPTNPDTDAHPTFIKGSGKNPAFLRLRDFVDSLVMTTESTLARDAAAAPLAKGKCRLPEQRQLRQHLGLPVGNAAGRARLKAKDFGSLLDNAGVPISAARVAQLVSLIGGPLPEVPALARSVRQPVPYLEAERLLLASLSRRGMESMLRQPPVSTHEGVPRVPKPPLPAWREHYMQAAVQAEAASAAVGLEGSSSSTVDSGGGKGLCHGGGYGGGGGSTYEYVLSELLPEQARPARDMVQSSLEGWWKGEELV